MKYPFLLIFITISVFGNAQTAEAILDKVGKTYQNASSYYIKFEFSDNENQAKEIGELFASKEKYNVELMDIRQMFDGKSLYTVSKEDKEITVSQPSSESNDFLSPTKILNIYKTNFKVALDKTENIDGKKVQYLKLTPKKNSEIKFAIIGIYLDSNTLYSYKETYGNNAYRIFTVKEYMENLIIPKALFKFDQSKYEKDGYIVTPL